MTPADFPAIDLIPCRREALDGAEFLKAKLFGGRFWDLLALYKGQWHYIQTVKLPTP